MVCAFFGHRDAPGDLREHLEEVIEDLILNGTDQFLVGNQGSFDRMVLGILRRMKNRYAHICYQVVLAYMPKGSENEYRPGETIFPGGLECVHPRYAIDRRNRWMIGESDIVIAYVIHNWGGAAKAVALAEKKGKKIIRL